MGKSAGWNEETYVFGTMFSQPVQAFFYPGPIWWRQKEKHKKHTYVFYVFMFFMYAYMNPLRVGWGSNTTI
jgi:hypothetical protein